MKVLLVALLFAVLATSISYAAENLVVNGDFQDNDGAKPKGWTLTTGFSLVKEGDKAWLKLNGAGQTSKWLKIDPTWKSVMFSCRIKGTDVVSGEKGWQTGSVVFDFRDSKHQHTGEWVNSPKIKGTTEWIHFEEEYPIPQGATDIKIDLANFGKSGTVEFDDIILVPVKYDVSFSRNATESTKKTILHEAQVSRAWIASFHSLARTEADECLVFPAEHQEDHCGCNGKRHRR